ncbi:MAG: hypothetical protein M1337_01055 [Actinobacteria bacterium]|nr:hypothetical protein [Actinomycetota bacterium]
MIRALRPTDVFTYLSFRNRALWNEALNRPGDKPAPSSLRAFLGRSLALDPRCQTWIKIGGGRIRGLVSVKARLGTDIWDIEHIVALPEEPEITFQNLLRHVSIAASEEGIQKVFLRTLLEDPLTSAAKLAGFFQYAVERIYYLPHPYTTDPTLVLRQRKGSDHHAIFHLYCSVVPQVVRQVEGITLQEWRWTEGWGFSRMGWRMTLPNRRRDFVLETDDDLGAWLQVRPRSRSIFLLAKPGLAEQAPDVLRFGMAQMPGVGPVFCPVRQYQTFIEPALEAEGFHLVGEHALFAKSLTVRVPERKLVPMRAHVSR